MDVFKWIGILVTILAVFFLLLRACFTRCRRHAEPVIPPESMPTLRPIPIPTKNRTPLMRLMVWLFETRRWVLMENWRFRLPEGQEIVLPAGFVFDGASIPRPFWWFLSPVGLLLLPGLVHDYGYKYDQLWIPDDHGGCRRFMEGSGRHAWDRLFREIGNDINGLEIIDRIAWLAVRAGGGGVWKRHRRHAENPTPPVLNG